MRRTIAGSRFLITGASSGIGRAVALELARRGARLVLTARREEKLRDAAGSAEALGADVELVVGDITHADTRVRALDAALRRFGGLDVLVNNAGTSGLGRFADADPHRLARIMDVNFFALVEMTRAALPVLRAGTRPMIVNVSSILGHRGAPHCAEYCASKFAVQGFSESLRAELAPAGIDVLVVSPGTTESEFFESVLEKTNATPWEGRKGVPAEAVARSTARAIERGRHEIIPSFSGRWLVRLNRFLPRIADVVMARYG